MSEWMIFKKPFLIIGIGVGVGVITCVVHSLRRQNTQEILRTESSRVNRAIKIPKGFVGHILGRGGATIKDIREKSKARVTFDDADREFTIASVSGSPEAVEEAVNLINNIISNRHACVTEEILLNGNIAESMWKNINHIRQVCDLTRAKVTFDFLPSRGKEHQPVKVVIKGRKEEVESALRLIDEMVAQVQVNSVPQTHVAGRALPENLSLHSAHMLSKNLPREKLIPSSSDGFVEVFISAIDTPSKFWVQIAGSKSVQLDKLATEMTEFYNEEGNRTRLQLSSISVGDIVSAFFQGDNSWYRAQVLKVEEEADAKKISVFYLDFGDCAILSPDLVSVLKPEYLAIPFQAVECRLAEVEPLHADGGWPQEASEELEKMVYLGQWKVVMAKPVERGRNGGDGQCVGGCDDPVQGVALMDTNSNQDVNIAEELVLRGHAKFVES